MLKINKIKNIEQARAELAKVFPYILNYEQIYCLHCGGKFNVDDIMIDESDGYVICPIQNCNGSPLDWKDTPWEEQDGRAPTPIIKIYQRLRPKRGQRMIITIDNVNYNDAIIQRMHNLVSLLNITNEKFTDEISLMKMEAESIMHDLWKLNSEE